MRVTQWPHIIKILSTFLKNGTFPTFFRQPFLEDGYIYSSILNMNCVLVNVKILKGFCIPCLRSIISFSDSWNMRGVVIKVSKSTFIFVCFHGYAIFHCILCFK